MSLICPALRGAANAARERWPEAAGWRPPASTRLLAAPVYVAPMADLDDRHNENIVLDFVDDPI